MLLRDPQTLLTLLALCAAAGDRRRRARLACELVERRGVQSLGKRPAAIHYQLALRQRAVLKWMGIEAVPVWLFPPRLSRIDPLPPVLFVRGSAQLLEREAVAIVGARNACEQAAAWATERAVEAARSGLLVVSGGARGVDAAAHWGAVRAGMPSLAYVGVAADRIYPAQNAPLFRHMLEKGGALVSEHPPCAETYKGDHAMRNRFIAAHASRVLIAEARERSGTLGTANWARRYDVPVWVSPQGVARQRGGLDWLLEQGHANVWLNQTTR